LKAQLIWPGFITLMALALTAFCPVLVSWTVEPVTNPNPAILVIDIGPEFTPVFA
jgi:hypothetical protein